jgi:hypothetical protein
VFYFPLWFAKDYEQYLHKKYSHKNIKFGEASGKTEWFHFWLPIRLIFWLLVFILFEAVLLFA